MSDIVTSVNWGLAQEIMLGKNVRAVQFGQLVWLVGTMVIEFYPDCIY